MNNQEAYDAALFGIRKQEYQRSMDGGQGCLYRGIHERKCAIGQSLPDALYEQCQPDKCSDNSTTEINSVMNDHPEIKEFYKDCSTALLGSLQEAHDMRLPADSAWEARMKELAGIYDLKYTAA